MGPIAGGILGSVVDFGVDAAKGWIGNLFYKKNAERQKEYNKELMKYQADLQQEYIDKQNAYNSPAQQMQRLQEAGLNPNLAYGNISSGVQTQAPQVKSSAPANYQQNQFNQLSQSIDIVSKFAQLQNTINQAKLSNAQVDKINSETSLIDVNSNVERWKYVNMLPLYKLQQEMRNEGIGYDNAFNKSRVVFADGNAWNEFRYLQNRAAISDYQVLRDNWYSSAGYTGYDGKWVEIPPYVKDWQLQYKKNSQSLMNMEGQLGVMELQKTALDLNNDFNDWYNKYRKKYRQQLRNPSGITGGVESSLKEFIFDF